jgi:signal transduction histidine kinase
VTALIGYAKTLRQPQFASDPQVREEFLERMERQGGRLLRLVENLLTAANVESRELPMSVGRVPFEELCHEIVEGLASESDRVALAIEPDLPPVVTDRQLLGRVLSNLLDNALKYSPEGTPCEVGARRAGDDLVFWVRDEGIGMPPEELDRIFERFYQVDSSSTRTFRGAGLGLSLVKNLLDHMGGRIEVDSAPGAGSTFTVTLPLRFPEFEGEASENGGQAVEPGAVASGERSAT